MHVDVLNAIVRERARIREEVINLPSSRLEDHGDIFIRRGDVLAILTENILKEGEEVTDELV